MPGERYQSQPRQFDDDTMGRKWLFSAPVEKMSARHNDDYGTRKASQDQMHFQNAFQSLAFELKLPSQDPGNHNGQSGRSCPKQIVVSRIRQAPPFGPERQEIENNPRARSAKLRAARKLSDPGSQI